LEPSVSGGDDVIGTGVPDEWLRVPGVVFMDKAVDRGLEMDDGSLTFELDPSVGADHLADMVDSFAAAHLFIPNFSELDHDAYAERSRFLSLQREIRWETSSVWVFRWYRIISNANK
jgi:hypothetical protein